MPLDEMADNLELECLFSIVNSCSIVAVAQDMGIGDDDDYEIDEDESNQNFLTETLGIIDARSHWCGGNYPFEADAQTIRMKYATDDMQSLVYTFLLLATRERMDINRIAAGIDGAALFERLSAQVLKNYFGEGSHVSVFGTGNEIHKSFEEKLKLFLSDIGEQGYSVINGSIDPAQKDGGIDLYVYIPFMDKKKGQFIGFGQCKTGSSWNSVLGLMRPNTLNSYISPALVFTPISLYMLSDTIPLKKWENLSRRSGGFIFDRCRLMNWLPKDLDSQILSDIRKWNEAVIERHK